MPDLSVRIINTIGRARAIYLEALSLIQTNKIVVSKSGIVTTTREQLKNKVTIFNKFNQAIEILNNLIKTSPEVEEDSDFTDLAQDIIEDYEKYLSAEDVKNTETIVGAFNNRLFISTQNTSIQQVNAVQTPQVQQTPQPEDYTQRTSTLNETELKQLNETQTPNQKQSLIDEEEDILDRLDVNEEGFVVVPTEVRNQFLSDDPSKFRTDGTKKRYADISQGVDAKNIKVKNKNFTLRADKIFEDEENIRYNVVIENIDNNCLIIDSIIQIAGTDLSIVDGETNISENEKLLNSSLSQNGVSKNKEAITTFVKTFRPDFDTVQSALGNIPFTVLTPDFLNQVDLKSVVICPRNTTTEAEVTQLSIGNTNQTGNPLSSEQYVVNKQGLLPYQVAVINEASKWANYSELNKDDWPITKFIKQKDGTIQQITDLSLVQLMAKYQKFKKGEAWCCAFQHSIIALGLENANLTSHPFYNYCSGNDDLDKGVGSSYQFVKNSGLLVPYPVPGCPAYFYKNGKPQHCILILEVRGVTGKPGAVYDCITIEGNSKPNLKVPAPYAQAGSKITGAEAGKGGKLLYRAADGGLEIRYTDYTYKFMGCAVPKEVQAKANGNYNIFITGNINY